MDKTIRLEQATQEYQKAQAEAAAAQAEFQQRKADAANELEVYMDEISPEQWSLEDMEDIYSGFGLEPDYLLEHLI
jgi:hypothetical protein